MQEAERGFAWFQVMEGLYLREGWVTSAGYMVSDNFLISRICKYPSPMSAKSHMSKHHKLREPRNTWCDQKLREAKEDSPLEGGGPASTLMQTFGPKKWEWIDFCCFKPPVVWQLVTTAIGSKCTFVSLDGIRVLLGQCGTNTLCWRSLCCVAVLCTWGCVAVSLASTNWNPVASISSPSCAN